MGLPGAWMPNFALDSVVVTVDGWDHHFGPVDIYCRLFFKTKLVMMTQSQTYHTQDKTSFGDIK
ncbi:hypothetical protein GL2_19680 [Microbulbifer sp. GL-2]|nr:hypothetical protein GL2_19680 [Microbulbifer sp. GL-2]